MRNLHLNKKVWEATPQKMSNPRGRPCFDVSCKSFCHLLVTVEEQPTLGVIEQMGLRGRLSLCRGLTRAYTLLFRLSFWYLCSEVYCGSPWLQGQPRHICSNRQNEFGSTRNKA